MNTDALLGLCDELMEAVRDRKANKNEIARMVRDFVALSDMRAEDLAAEIGVAGETLSRWVRGQRTPWLVNIARLQAFVERHATTQTASGAVAEVRIGIAPFWDCALIRAFDVALRSQGIHPKYVKLDGWHEAAQQMFRYRKIDVAVHNEFLEMFDTQMPDRYRCKLKFSHPLFSFHGHHVFVHRNRVLRVCGTSGDARLNDFCSGKVRRLVPERHEESIRLLLNGAAVGVERGTDLEAALRQAYRSVGLDFLSHADINRRSIDIVSEDGPVTEMIPINGRDQDPNDASTADAFEQFRNGRIDVFCGGLPHWRFLTRTANSYEYLILFEPADLAIQSVNGLVATETYSRDHREVLRRIADAWYAGADRFVTWVEEATSGDEYTRNAAIAQLHAVLRRVEEYMPEDNLRVLQTDPTKATSWEQRIRDLLADRNAPCGEQLASLAVDTYRRYVRELVIQWGQDMCNYDTLYTDKATALSGEKLPEELVEAYGEMQRTLIEAKFGEIILPSDN